MPAIEMSGHALLVIKGVRELFSDPANHTTGAAARNAQGHETFVNGPDATCWCAVGGMMRVESQLGGYGNDDITATQALARSMDLIAKSDSTRGRSSLVGLNEDGRVVFGENGEELTGLPGILRLLDYTIENAVVV